MEGMKPSKYYLRRGRKERQVSNIAEECPSNGNVCLVSLSDRTHVNELSIEMLGMIFSYLTPAELARSVLPVCTLWNDIANGVFFWRHLKFGPHVTTEDVVRVVTKATLLKSIELHNRNDLEPIFRAIYKNCRNNNTKIEEISLKVGPPRGSIKIDGLLVGTQYRTCCDSPNCFPNSLEDGVIKAPCSTQMMRFCPHLKKLTLSNVIIRSQMFYDHIGTTLQSLTELTLIRCYHFTPANLQTIADNCTRLTHVTLLQNVFKSFLVSDAIRNSWNQAYHALLEKRGAFLQVLEIDALFVRDSTLEALSKSTSLHTLCLENAKYLSANGISAISTLECLKHLHIHNCLGLEKGSIRKLFAPGNLCTLETLAIPKCCRVADCCLGIVTASCPSLSKVDISYCHQITDRGIKFLLQRCIKLHYLNAFKTDGVHGSSLDLIPPPILSLQLLVVEKYCKDVKENFIRYLISSFPDLQIKRV